MPHCLAILEDEDEIEPNSFYNRNLSDENEGSENELFGRKDPIEISSTGKVGRRTTARKIPIIEYADKPNHKDSNKKASIVPKKASIIPKKAPIVPKKSSIVPKKSSIVLKKASQVLPASKDIKSPSNQEPSSFTLNTKSSLLSPLSRKIGLSRQAKTPPLH